MDYKKIKSKKIYEQVADAIFESIKSGQLKPGEKLDSIERLAENFQVGRSAIREALSALRSMGLIDLKQGEGTYVKKYDSTLALDTSILMTKKDILHLLEVRKILETGSAASAAAKFEIGDEIPIEQAYRDMKNARENQALGEEADLLFHLEIAKASKNPLLADLMHQVSGMMIETMRETRRIALFDKDTTINQINEEHVEIIKAIKAKDSQAASAAMMKHLENVEKVLTHFLDKQK